MNARQRRKRRRAGRFGPGLVEQCRPTQLEINRMLTLYSRAHLKIVESEFLGFKDKDGRPVDAIQIERNGPVYVSPKVYAELKNKYDGAAR